MSENGPLLPLLTADCRCCGDLAVGITRMDRLTLECDATTSRIMLAIGWLISTIATSSRDVNSRKACSTCFGVVRPSTTRKLLRLRRSTFPTPARRKPVMVSSSAMTARRAPSCSSMPGGALAMVFLWFFGGWERGRGRRAARRGARSAKKSGVAGPRAALAACQTRLLVIGSLVSLTRCEGVRGGGGGRWRGRRSGALSRPPKAGFRVGVRLRDEGILLSGNELRLGCDVCVSMCVRV